MNAVTHTPTVSVVMPVYNGERYLTEAVNSILSQTFGDFEFVAVNDGSVDRSLEILAAFASRDKRLKIVNQSNAGIVSALNVGIGNSTAPWIARMDSDDVALPQRLELQLSEVERYPDLVALGCLVELMDPDGLPIAPSATKISHEEIDSAHMQGIGGAAICHPSALLNRAAVLRVGGYRTEFQYAEDLDLFLRLAEIGRIGNLPEILLKYRLHPTAIGYTRRLEQVQKATRAVAEARARRGLPNESIDVVPSSTSSESAHALWAWWAIRGGHLKTARRHAWLAVRERPTQIQNWRALYCALRGR